MMLIREKIGFYLEDIETPIGKWLNLLITGLVLISTGTFVAETYALEPELANFLHQLDSAIMAIFTIEYVVRLVVAQKRWQYVFSFYALIDFVAIFPFLFGVFDASFLRVFRWFRILRLIRFIEGRTAFGNLDRHDSLVVTRIIFTICSIIFVYSGLIYQVEHPVNPRMFGTFLDAIYFSVATMTTVGFGDITPISTMGRLLTVLMILTGIALIPWQLGDLVKQVVKSGDKVSKTCASCQLASHETDALFCKRCGKALG
jgi:voltage-gated potassium channel